MVWRVAGVFFVLSLLAGPAPVSATADGLTLEPFLQEVTLEADQPQAEFTVTVENHSQTTLDMRVSALDFKTLDESGGVAFLGARGNEAEYQYALAGWLEPEVDNVILEPGQRREIVVRVDNRDSLAPGGHYGAIVFQLQSGESPLRPNSGEASNAESGRRVAVNQFVASLVFLKKTGGERYSIALHSLGVQETWRRFFSLPEQARLRFHNSGNVYVVPRGTVEISDSLGRLVGRGIINSDSALLLPESFRVYPTPMDPVEPVFWPGRYSLNAKWRYDGREDFTVVERSFFVLPPLTIFGILALMGLGWSILTWSRTAKAFVK